MSTPSELRLFRTALGTQARVVGALVLREMRVRYGRSRLGYFWALAEPVGYVATLSIMFELGGLPAPFGTSMALFFALGVVPFRLFLTLGNQLGGALSANEALLTYPIVQEIDTVIARFILEVLTSVAVLIIMLATLTFALALPPPRSLPEMSLGLALIAAFGFGVGLFNAVMTKIIASWQNIFHIITAPLLFVSAVFYSLASLPPHVRDLLIWNPLVHGVELVRYGYYRNYRAPGLDVEYLAWLALAIVLLALLLERSLRANQA